MEDHALYAELAEYYDRFYWWKDYRREIDFLVKLLDRYGVKGRRILEVACGTGTHTKLLAARGYKVTGVDLSQEQLAVARRKLRGRAEFVRGDMRDLDSAVEGTYDCVICFFSSISYNLTVADLRKTLQGFHRHLEPGGITVFDTHFTGEGFIDGYRGEDIFDDGRVMGARLSTSKREGRVGELSFSYLIKDGRKVIQLRNDVHRLGLFRRADVEKTMRHVGFRDILMFADWRFERLRTTSKFKDSIFAGRKAPS